MAKSSEAEKQAALANEPKKEMLREPKVHRAQNGETGPTRAAAAKRAGTDEAKSRDSRKR